MSTRVKAGPGMMPAALYQRMQELARSGKSVLVAVDGRCGSGKTALGTTLGYAFHCPVVHTDDYYLPFARRPANWQTTPAANMDFARLRAEVLDPLRAGQEGVSRPYNCHDDTFGAATPLPAGHLVILEGSYSHHPALGRYDLTVFVTCPEPCREERLRAREGDRFPMFLSRWIPLEEGYFRAFGIEEKADFLVDTGTEDF